MVVFCSWVFPLTERERATAEALERRIDLILRETGMGNGPPAIEDDGLRNMRISSHLSLKYVRAGWRVRYSSRGYMEFAPSMEYLAAHEPPEIVELIRASWKY